MVQVLFLGVTFHPSSTVPKVGHSGTITCAAISPDASFVVSTGSEAFLVTFLDLDATLTREWWAKWSNDGGQLDFFFSV